MPRAPKRRICDVCGRPTTPTDNRGGRHLECRRAAFVEDFLFMIETGAGWGEIVARFGITPESIERRTATACNAKPACKRGCNEFVPGATIGRDQEPSCLTCTHSRAIHQQPKTPTKKAARR